MISKINNKRSINGAGDRGDGTHNGMWTGSRRMGTSFYRNGFLFCRQKSIESLESEEESIKAKDSLEDQ